MITQDHTKIRQQARKIAQKHGVWQYHSHSDDVVAEFKQAISELKTAPLTSFDESYMATEVDFSRFAIHQVEHVILPAIKTLELKLFIELNLQRMQTHMAHILMAESDVKNGNVSNMEHHHHHH